MKKRTVIISVTVVLLLAVGVTAFAFWKRHRVDLKVLKVRELQAKLRDPNLTPEQLALQFQEMRKAMEQLAPEQRMQMMRSRRNPAATYFALPPDQRAEFLNQQIEEQEKRRQAWEDARAQAGDQQGQGNGGGGQNRPRGNNPSGVAGQGRLNFRKQMLDMSTPAERVQTQIYIVALNNQRAQQGLPPLRGGGFF